ncbi:MAG: type II toxin-antitoxin system VapC family toxin [Gammaproteobacteria bacterium]|nr:type II toxin-antitoxin system VapC family toxin [Gammaproteobacteria bacterium]MBU1724619.1 type II toxin-antitoxin system VapC family toxin [Gammaproteobacteria bacterium]MBU2006466.1 type II toxin-antitoxin system VapC family toxin [Gammaproteobacteria bacterium]
MKALLDTHTLLWLVDSPEKLPSIVATICEDGNNELYISIASFWELAIKMSLGKIELESNALERLKSWCDDNAIQLLPISIKHCQQVQTLPFHHRDPFDRLLIAQALCDRLALLSVDGHFADYGVDVVWKQAYSPTLHHTDDGEGSSIHEAV